MNNREDVLLQIWRDYYDEILEVDLERGSFESLMNTDETINKKGNLYIETMIMANKMVHPDDRDDFLKFFNPQKIFDDMKKDIFVSKLNFRVHKGDKEYFWVKVKGIMPSRHQLSQNANYFACFRILDPSSEEDYGYMQRISSELMREKEKHTNRMALLEQYTDEIRDPVDGIKGLSQIAQKQIENPEKLVQNITMIEEECTRIQLLLDEMVLQIGDKGAAPIIMAGDMKEKGKASVMQRKRSESEESSSDEENMLRDEELQEELLAAPQQVIPRIEDFDFKGMNILAFIDNTVGARIMTEMISATSATPFVFTSGKEAVKAYISGEAGKFDAVLLDSVIDDFGMGSVARCIRLSCKDDAETIPIIAMTDKTNISATRNIDGAKFNDVFRKPIDFGLLFLKVQELIKAEKGT